ncbi:hypothetical protein IV203_009339 [Nitzschia inconspicua]|uniref:Uncharacterized protein n=1 Tax=Nitzschia inconspicua TaxID=303405 RepID=A0A9K3PMV2_9STRA|nr:hypothetical protein IV203_009339 [Nitzschia inconspicua]
MAAAVHPSVCQADENGDPFAAMDAAISVGLSSSTFNDVSKNNNDSNVKEATTQSPSSNNIPGSPATSDFENALQESKRRKSIDPLTHG